MLAGSFLLLASQGFSMGGPLSAPTIPVPLGLRVVPPVSLALPPATATTAAWIGGTVLYGVTGTVLTALVSAVFTPDCAQLSSA